MDVKQDLSDPAPEFGKSDIRLPGRSPDIDERLLQRLALVLKLSDAVERVFHRRKPMAMNTARMITTSNAIAARMTRAAQMSLAFEG